VNSYVRMMRASRTRTPFPAIAPGACSQMRPEGRGGAWETPIVGPRKPRSHTLYEPRSTSVNFLSPVVWNGLNSTQTIKRVLIGGIYHGASLPLSARRRITAVQTGVVMDPVMYLLARFGPRPSVAALVASPTCGKPEATARRDGAPVAQTPDMA
jgi:hypothetical protein